MRTDQSAFLPMLSQASGSIISVNATPTSDNLDNKPTANAMADQSQIDPRLFAGASSLPPRAQLYTTAPQQNTGHPYYLPSPTTQHQPPQLSQPAPLGNILDPALEQTSPIGPEASHDEEEPEDEGGHDGYVINLSTTSLKGEAWRASRVAGSPIERS
jgi:hypothetical protein